MVAAAVSEICTNAIRYAGTGKITVNQTSNKRGIEIIISDKGPGIKDINKAMADGFTSMANLSFGVGLGAAKRAMDFFEINSKPGVGTEVIMRKYLKQADINIEYGIISIPDNLREVNGDDYFIKEFEGDKILISVIDGLGEGINARRSATLVKDILQENFSEPLEDIIKKCDQEIRAKRERGATIGILLLKPENIEYASVGDTFINIFPKTKKSFFSQPGIVGTKAVPNIRVITAPFPKEESVIIMCSDGIHDHINKDDINTDLRAQEIAEKIMQLYRRKYGDATVLVAKITP